MSANVRLIRQFVLLVSLMFWQGGFMFYGGVVVEVGSRVLGSDTQQGFITQSVTNYLNIAGAVCLAIWLENLWHERHRGVSKLEWFAWALTAAMLFALVVIHPGMDQLLDARSTAVIDHSRFRLFHKAYIGISSLQWMVVLLSLLLVLRRWDRGVRH
jgi:hypothetical protein